MAYYTKGAFTDDPWADREIVPVAELVGRPAAETLPAAPLGVLIQPGFDVEAANLDLGAIGLIAMAFPKFTDGRGYSVGWLLRGRFGYRGELRAPLLRCGE